MTFLAHIRRHTVLWRDWVAHSRVTGSVAGIMFRWVSGENYVSDILTTDQIKAAKEHSNVVTLEMVETPPKRMTGHPR